jgi:3-oxo-5-alpha-steroid 4-dehydrogenase 1
VAWIFMELPSAVSFAIVAGPALGRISPVGLVLFALWSAHYLHRGLIYPLRLRSPRRVPLSIVIAAAAFTTFNGALNAWGLYHAGSDLGSAGFGHVRFVAGVALFVVGAAINMDADNRLLATPRGPNGEYAIPQGGLYRFVSSPNYLGELMEWAGWAVAAGTGAAIAFLIWSAANLVPRAYAHHAWYRRTFADYPSARGALFPHLTRRAPRVP